MFAASMVLLNSRFGCLVALSHAVGTAVAYNMSELRPYALKAIDWYYKAGTPFHEKPSPCMPQKEFLETELPIDKSSAFDAAFWSK